jgi:hypothetical protein
MRGKGNPKLKDVADSLACVVVSEYEPADYDFGCLVTLFGIPQLHEFAESGPLEERF